MPIRNRINQDQDAAPAVIRNRINQDADIDPVRDRINQYEDADIRSRAVLYSEAQTLSGAQQDQAKENIGIPKNNYSAVTAPTVTDDADSGYSIGSLWIDTVSQESYLCVDASVGAAVWRTAGVNAQFPSYANLAAANAAIGVIGIPFFNIENNRHETTTDIA